MKNDSVIFDIDGVLVDVNGSYRIAIEKTVNFWLKSKNLSAQITQQDVSAIKNIPGFNNDWDAAYRLITLVSNGIKTEKFSKTVKTVGREDKKNILYKEVKDIFQTSYLGSRLFRKTEKRASPLNVVRGLIGQEKCLISPKVLDKLVDMKLKLGIVTGRPRNEALMALENSNLEKFFPADNIVALEDTLEEKPSPEPLLEIKRKMKLKSPIYVGDTINDVIAAKRAQMKIIFIGENKLGDYQFSSVNKILEVFL